MVCRSSRNNDTAAVRSQAARSAPKKLIRDPKRTKRRILFVASSEFANKGYDGAWVDEIVRRSKFSKNLIFYYFDSKEELFMAVLESAFVNLRRQQDTHSLNDMPPEEAIKKLIVDLFHYWQKSRVFVGLLTSENFHRAEHIKKSKFAPGAFDRLIENLSAVLEAGVKQGIFRDGVDPVNLCISILGLSYQYFSDQYTLSFLLDKDLTSKEALESRLKHTEDIILGYLRHACR